MDNDSVLERRPLQKVNIGCGSRYIEDWINFDFVSTSPSVVAHDLSQGIPLTDNSVDFVYTSHVLEHFNLSDGYHLLSECFRILKPGGHARIVVPDTELLARNYLTHLASEKKTADPGKPGSLDYEWAKLALFDQFSRNYSGGEMLGILASQDEHALKNIFQLEGSEFRDIHHELVSSQEPRDQAQTFGLREAATEAYKIGKHWLIQKLIGHRWEEELTIGRFRLGGEVHYAAYDDVSLARAMREAGFSSISRHNANSSNHNNWSAYNLDTEDDGQPYKPNSLYMEGAKV